MRFVKHYRLMLVQFTYNWITFKIYNVIEDTHEADTFKKYIVSFLYFTIFKIKIVFTNMNNFYYGTALKPVVLAVQYSDNTVQRGQHNKARKARSEVEAIDYLALLASMSLLAQVAPYDVHLSYPDAESSF